MRMLTYVYYSLCSLVFRPLSAFQGWRIPCTPYPLNEPPVHCPLGHSQAPDAKYPASSMHTDICNLSSITECLIVIKVCKPEVHGNKSIPFVLLSGRISHQTWATKWSIVARVSFRLKFACHSSKLGHFPKRIKLSENHKTSATAIYDRNCRHVQCSLVWLSRHSEGKWCWRFIPQFNYSTHLAYES